MAPGASTSFDVQAEPLRARGPDHLAGAAFTPYDPEALARSLEDFAPEETDERNDITEKTVTCPACEHTWAE